MKCIDRNGNEVKQNEAQNKVLAFLYNTMLGRLLLLIIIKPWFTKFVGLVFNLPISKILIQPFIKKNQINLSEYEPKKYISYNDFFTRRIKSNCRIFDYHPKNLISPCDSKLSVYSINNKARFKIKGTIYSMESLLRSKKLASQYNGGLLLVFRLTVDNYHRYCFIDDGIKTKNHHIQGFFHTVNPLANDVFPIYKENTREFSVLRSENFGNVLMMEVGALIVGKINNYHEEAIVKKGEEKGMFEFGGSTVILCFEKNIINVDEDILKNSLNGIETAVKMGEKIGKAAY